MAQTRHLWQSIWESLIHLMNKAYSHPINKGYPNKSLDTENLSRGSLYLEVYSFWKRNQQFTYSLCAQLTYASSNSRTEQAYSLLMNKFMFTVSKTSLKLASSASICWTPFTLSGWYYLRWLLECQMDLWNVMGIELGAISKFVTKVANLWPKMVFPLFSPL